MRGDTIATIATYLHRFVDRETLQTHYGASQRLKGKKGCGETYQERSVTDHCLHHRATGALAALNFNMGVLLFTTVSVDYRVTMATRSKSKEIQLKVD